MTTLNPKISLRTFLTFLSIFLLTLPQIHACFTVHFVFYGNDICCFYFQRLTKFPHPYTIHFNQDIKFTDGFTISRQLKNIQKSDIKRMEVLYRHGGLYLDNDQLIDLECVKKYICPLKQANSEDVYVLDWTDRDANTWKQSVPISFIYSPKPHNPIFQKILRNYNESQTQPMKFSGPSYIQSFRNEFKHIKIKQTCQKHINAHSWVYIPVIEMTPQKYMLTANWNDIYLTKMTKNQLIQLQKTKQFYFKLLRTHSIIYPMNYNYQEMLPLDLEYNHVQIINLQNYNIKVKLYSSVPQYRSKLEALQSIYNQFKINKISEGLTNQQIPLELKEILEDKQKITKQIEKIKQKQQQIIKKQKQLQLDIESYKYQLQKTTNIKQPSRNIDTDFTYRLQKLKIFYTVLSICIIFGTVVIFAHFYLYLRQMNKNKRYNKLRVIQEEQALGNSNQSLVKSRNNFVNNKILFVILYLFVVNFWMYTYKMMDGYGGVGGAKEKFGVIQSNKEILFLEDSERSVTNKSYKKIYAQKYGFQLYPTEKQPIYETSLEKIGLLLDVQIGSKYDYLNLEKTQQFYDFKMHFIQSIEHEVFELKYNASLDRKKQMIQYTEFWNYEQIENALENIEQWSGRPKVKKNTLTYLASGLVYNHRSDRIKQMEYYYYNKTLQLDQIQTELPMCVISTGYNVFSKNKYRPFFESLERQNYSNFRVVIVDDSSPDHSARRFLEYLNSTDFSIKNKVKIVRNAHKIGALGSMYIYVKKYCPTDSIVLNIDTDDALIGYQAFNILNAVYQDPEVWYVYTKYFMQLTSQSAPLLGEYSLPLTVDVSEYRTHKDWNTSHMRTYRQQVMDRVPIEQYIEYYYDQQVKMLLPRFYIRCADRFQVYSHLQISGNDRVKFLQIPLYFYDQSGTIEACHYQQVHYSEYKSRIKRKIKRLDSFQSDLQYFPDRQFSADLIHKFEQAHILLDKCEAVHHKKYNFV